ncbi:uncharacterized protein MYCFIDRAFT_170367 [Pseudocercospora fijiensis CIRAD86]|uniref:Uncharacterized protein n=1 Tax=Pseudocercospora fijiensis (strain CIRAD86) TaxID=383855 RepID=N1QBX7_PSEFD|nr:uncharacterized protein MYCFIDRAFT_170367 [Pseudocercospora fijiensis CIRAD86]EME88792.1 hypothetical protein MYCFIDRAFT_170367 [Pseudocercospora fijiensis CIRAD86]
MQEAKLCRGSKVKQSQVGLAGAAPQSGLWRANQRPCLVAVVGLMESLAILRSFAADICLLSVSCAHPQLDEVYKTIGVCGPVKGAVLMGETIRCPRGLITGDSLPFLQKHSPMSYLAVLSIQIPRPFRAFESGVRLMKYGCGVTQRECGDCGWTLVTSSCKAHFAVITSSTNDVITLSNMAPAQPRMVIPACRLSAFPLRRSCPSWIKPDDCFRSFAGHSANYIKIERPPSRQHNFLSPRKLSCLTQDLGVGGEILGQSQANHNLLIDDMLLHGSLIIPELPADRQLRQNHAGFCSATCGQLPVPIRIRHCAQDGSRSTHSAIILQQQRTGSIDYQRAFGTVVFVPVV